MSTEHYFNGPDSFEDIPHALPLGWQVEGTDGDPKLRFIFPMVGDTPDASLIKAQHYVFEHAKAHDTDYVAQYEEEESEVERDGIQELFVIETQYPLHNGVFRMLRTTQQVLAFGAWAAMKTDVEAFNAAAK